MNKKKHIALIGLKSSGKTSVGQALAKNNDAYTFIDSDSLIENHYFKIYQQSHSFRRIHQLIGETLFRQWEHQLITEATSQAVNRAETLVIATGGSTMLNSSTARQLQSVSIIIMLDATMETLLQRWKSRPPGFIDPQCDIKTQLEAYRLPRQKKYQQLADLIVSVDGLNPKAISQIIIRQIQE